MAKNLEIAQIFEEMADFLEMQGVEFKPRAYQKGARTLESLTQDIEQVYKKGGLAALEDLPGIGQSMAEKIEEYLKTGHIKEYDTLKKKTPVDIDELTSVEGVGPKTVKALYKKLKIKNLEELEEAAKQHKIRELEGFGEKTEKNILQGIKFVKRNRGRMLLGYVWPRVQSVLTRLRKMKEIERAEVAGSARRRKETIGDIDILIATKKNSPQKVLERFIENTDGVIRVWGAGKTKTSFRVEEGFDIDVRAVPKESYGSALQYFTGNKAHNIKTRKIAIGKGLKLNEYGVFRGKKQIAGKTEKEVYEAIGLPLMPPEIRRDTGEIEIAQEKGPSGLPNLIPYGSLKSDLQVQTNWTDGSHSIEEMAREAKKLGLEYIAITDHTKSLAMTRGSDEKKLLRQIKEIKKLNKKIKGITILSGAEVNIMKDGNLDIDDEVLAQLDVVGISVHSNFNMSKKDMTERIARAMRNPHADILFHPTGRLIQRRDSYALDMKQIFKTAQETGTILEINAYPERLDLKDDHIREAVEMGGIKFCINSDAHAKQHFQYLEFGIAQARRGWATESHIINTLPVKKMLKQLKP